MAWRDQQWHHPNQSPFGYSNTQTTHALNHQATKFAYSYTQPDVEVLEKWEPTYIMTNDGFIVPAEYQESWEKKNQSSNRGAWSCQDPSHQKLFFFTFVIIQICSNSWIKVKNCTILITTLTSIVWFIRSKVTCVYHEIGRVSTTAKQRYTCL